MSDDRLAEFDQFRFIRQEAGALAELPGTGGNERLFLVIDCRRFRLARLHIFEGRAKHDPEIPALFRREFEAISALRHPALGPLISFGRDDTELFFADAVVDGESLRDYLRRTGPMPPASALRAALDLANLLLDEPDGTHTLSHYSSRNLFVKPSAGDGLSLVFTDFTGWDRSEIEDRAEKEGRKVRRVAVTLYSMLAGQILDSEPPLPFSREAKDAPELLKDFLKRVFLREGTGSIFKNLRDFTAVARTILPDLPEEEPPLPPRRFFRDWLLRGLGDDLNLGPDFRILSKKKGAGSSLFEDGYTIDAATTRGLTYKRLRFHLYPNQASIPRAGWMLQHRYSLRTHSRPLPNQATVESLYCGERFCLIGESWIDGVDMASIVEDLGPLSFDHAREIGKKLTAALDSMEAIAGACPIWWLPPENLFVITGSDHPDSVHHALGKNGVDTWKRTPLRLRLHQTGEALLEGVNLPRSMMDLLHAGSKDRNHIQTRRSAVLLPILWFVVTGERLDWREPLPRHGAFPREILDLLEETRRRLVDSPEEEPGRLLDRIDSALRNKTLELKPFLSGAGPLALGKQARRPLLPAPGIESASPPSKTGDPEKRPDEPVFLPAEDQPVLVEKVAATPIPEPAAPQEEKIAGASETGTALPSPAEAGAPEALGAKPEAAAKEETHWVKRVVGAPLRASRRLVQPAAGEQDDSPHDGFGERLLIPHVKSEAEKKEASAKAREKRRRKSAKPTLPVRSKRGESQSDRSSAFPMMLFLAAACVLSGITWGVVAVYRHFSTTINQQVLSETFAPVHYTPVTTSASEFAIPRLSHSSQETSAALKSEAAALPAVLTPIEETASAKDAIASGDKAQDAGQLAAAVAWYLRALKIDADSAAAKEKIAATLGKWTAGDGPGIDSQPVADLVEQAAGYSPDASLLLADFYLERDHEAGLRWLQRSSEAGHPRHQVMLGLIFARGQLVPQELSIAARWFQRAANKGDVDGQFHFGECLILGDGITRDAPRGIDFLERAARAGDPRALELLGICHAKGDGVSPDGKRAREYFELAMKGGNISAYYNLAVRYAKGHGVEKSETIAARTFLEGAEKGSVPCMYAFGRCLETGFGVGKSFKQARIWLTKAATLGEIEAQAWCAHNEVPFDKPAELLSGF